MNFSILLLLAIPIFASAGELRIAQFDLDRAFKEYEHTKQMEREIAQRRNIRPSGNNLLDLAERYQEAVEKAAEAEKALSQAVANRKTISALKLNVAETRLDASKLELQISRSQVEREKKLRAESLERRSMLLREIAAQTDLLGGELGYHVVIPRTEVSFEAPLVVRPTATASTAPEIEDITEKLLARLNKEYAERKAR